ncbi:MAG: UDP-N-acetylmuramate dehydrogenase [Actinomycetes bacterium]
MAALADFTTLHVGGVPRSMTCAQSESEIIDAVRDADAQGRRILILGGGSNIIAADELELDVIQICTTGFENDPSACAGAWVTVQAGHNWEEFVAQAVANEWTGVEALSGIPGTVGATPIQNVGAYGQQVSDSIAQVRAWNRETQEVDTLFADSCEFSYRSSIFKLHPERWVILSVTFQLKLGTLSSPVQFDELARELGVELGARVPMVDVRHAVLALRRRKGMVVDPTDHDTWSTGSCFLNPRVTQAPQGAPAWEQPDGRFKVSAAWLIENAGFAKGFGVNTRATLSTKHTLAITNRGSATATDILELAEVIQAGVLATYGISLEFEPQVVR